MSDAPFTNTEDRLEVNEFLKIRNWESQFNMLQIMRFAIIQTNIFIPTFALLTGLLGKCIPRSQAFAIQTTQPGSRDNSLYVSKFPMKFKNMSRNINFDT